MVTSTARRIQRYLLSKGFECTSQHVRFNESPIDRILTLPLLSIKKKKKMQRNRLGNLKL